MFDLSHLPLFVIVVWMSTNYLPLLVFLLVFRIQTVAQEARDPAPRAANKTGAACLEAPGMKTPRTTDVSAISPARVCQTTQ